MRLAQDRTDPCASDFALLTGLSVLLAFLSVASLAIGPAGLTPHAMWNGLAAGTGIPGLIMRDVRLPRLALSLEVGFSLGLAGAALQGLLRNPLADPAVFGAPQTAALGAVIVLYYGLADTSSYALPLAAVLGAACSVGLVIFVGSRGGLASLLLSGLAIGSLAGAAIALAINLSPDPYAATEIVFWLMGSFDDRTLRDVALATPFIAASCVTLLACGPGLRLLSLGEEVAESLGAPIHLLRLAIVGAVALGVGGGVAVSGAIGFVGLVTPHFVRPFVGSDPQRTLLPSGLAGACLVVAADLGVRLVPSASEIRVGVLTSLLGAPIFIWLAVARKAAFEDSR